MYSMSWIMMNPTAQLGSFWGKNAGFPNRETRNPKPNAGWRTPTRKDMNIGMAKSVREVGKR